MSIEYPCVHFDKGKCKKFSDDKVTSWCVEGPCIEQMLSNADRIRAMTDDELNDLFHDIYDSGAYDAVSYGCGHQTNSFEWTMEWLQQPMKGE